MISLIKHCFFYTATKNHLPNPLVIDIAILNSQDKLDFIKASSFFCIEINMIIYTRRIVFLGQFLLHRVNNRSICCVLVLSRHKEKTVFPWLVIQMRCIRRVSKTRQTFKARQYDLTLFKHILKSILQFYVLE